MQENDMQFDEPDTFETTTSYQPRNNDYDTFSKRNDPKPLLHRLKLQLLNAYEEEVEEKDESGRITRKKKIKRIPNTEPLANKHGIQQIVSYIERSAN